MSMLKFKLYFIFVSLFLSNTSFSQVSEHYIDLSISVFDMNLPESELLQNQLNIYPEVRAAESRYVPALLRATLQESDRWGVIRIIPNINENSELMISGSILRSDGLVLELQINAIDSTGREWLNRIYSSTALDSISLNNPDLSVDPFQTIYNQIGNDLAEVLTPLSATDLTQIKTMAFLRYGAFLSPDSFSSYIQTTPEGRYFYSSLPASNDPMLSRVEDIRQYEYLFIDEVDEQYQNYLVNIKPVYDLWRNYTQELTQNNLDYQARQVGDNSQFRRGTYRALRESYDNFRWQKMQTQYLDQLSEGFSNETLPTEIKMQDRVFELSGTLENQYWEWRDILRDLFELEGNNLGAETNI